MGSKEPGKMAIFKIKKYKFIKSRRRYFFFKNETCHNILNFVLLILFIKIYKKFVRPQTFLILVLCILFACQDEKTYSSETEKIYFEEYESPKYKWGFINEKGQLAIEAKYDDVRDFNSLLTAANYRGRWGYINAEGRTVIDFLYQQALDFENNITVVQNFKDIWLIINNKGQLIDSLDVDYANAPKFNHVITSKDGYQSLYDLHGNLVLSNYKKLSFLNGFWLIAKKDTKYGVIDVNNNVILDFEYDKIYPSEHFLRLKKDKEYRLFDLESKKNLLPSFDRIYEIIDDYILVKDGEKFFILDKTLEKISAIAHAHVESLGCGLFKYKSDNKYGLINANGDLITGPIYMNINRCHSNHLVYSKNDLFGYLKTNGEELTPAIFVLAWDFHNYKARMIHERGIGFIDTTGKLVVNDMFYEVRDFYQGLARYQHIQ